LGKNQNLATPETFDLLGYGFVHFFSELRTVRWIELYFHSDISRDLFENQKYRIEIVTDLQVKKRSSIVWWPRFSIPIRAI